jgi:tetratricopeptide (TPR) repeat protein
LEGLGRYRDALQCCERAETILVPLIAADHELAIVRYMHATLLARIEELDTALAMIKDVERVFGMYGDTKRYIRAKTLHGYLLHRAGRTDETLALWTSLIEQARAVGDLKTVASLYCNVGEELRLKGDISRATWYLRMALKMFADHQMFSDLPRPRLTLAHIQVQKGDLHGALPSLWRVFDEFTALGMRMAAANVQLEIVEILLAVGDLGEAKRLCRDLPELYLEGGLIKNAQLAGTYLRECAERDDMNVKDVQHVRLYLQDLPQNPTRPFTPPPRRAGR